MYASMCGLGNIISAVQLEDFHSILGLAEIAFLSNCLNVLPAMTQDSVTEA